MIVFAWEKKRLKSSHIIRTNTSDPTFSVLVFFFFFALFPLLFFSFFTFFFNCQQKQCFHHVYSLKPLVYVILKPSRYTLKEIKEAKLVNITHIHIYIYRLALIHPLVKLSKDTRLLLLIMLLLPIYLLSKKRFVIYG